MPSFTLPDRFAQHSTTAGTRAVVAGQGTLRRRLGVHVIGAALSSGGVPLGADVSQRSRRGGGYHAGSIRPHIPPARSVSLRRSARRLALSDDETRGNSNAAHMQTSEPPRALSSGAAPS